jgi:alkanesulfonate monooxygenase SsuD/methylene tetrahydromethanopterin reductase-like flavin-dependent oxidoreductase (luciferase family)
MTTPADLLDSSQLTFGVGAPSTADGVRAFEDLGVDSLWVGGHISSRNPTPETMVALARLSAMSTSAVIGTSIVLAPLFPPGILAKQSAEIDRASGGRVVLGIGVGGEYPQEFSACQVPVSERGSRTNEALPLMRRLWSGETVDHDGPHYPMQGVVLRPPPAQPGGPPIVVAGRKPVAMRRAAALGDGWMPYLYSPRRYRASVELITEHAASIGRDLSNFGWMLYTFVNVRDDGPSARRELARFIGGTYDQDIESMLPHVAVAGTPDEVVEHLVDFVDAGVRHITFSPCPRDDGDTLVRTLYEQIIPALRARITVG